MKQRNLLITVIFVCLACTTLASDSDSTNEFTSLRAKGAKRKYESAVKNSKREYLRNLKIALHESTRAGKLDEANLIAAEIKLISESLEPTKESPKLLVLGVWEYRIGGSILQRELTEDGHCILSKDGKVTGKYKYEAESPSEVKVKTHMGIDVLKLQKDGTLELTTFRGQKFTAVRKSKEGEATSKNDISSLSKEDQELIKGLKFSDPVAAPIDSRRLSYIKGRIEVRNKNSRHTITDKLQIEMRMLCRNRDKEWSVIRGVSKFDITEKGSQVIKVSFADYNEVLDKLNTDRNDKLYDTYTVVRYLGIIIFEEEARGRSSFPENWWKDDSLIYQRRK